MVLDLLCSLLLAVPPRLVDAEGGRYVRWACQHLQGGRVRRSSPFWPIFHDCELGLRSAAAAQRAARKAGQQAQPPSTAHSQASSTLPQLSRRSAPLQSLASIAGAVASTVAHGGKPLCKPLKTKAGSRQDTSHASSGGVE